MKLQLSIFLFLGVAIAASVWPGNPFPWINEALGRVDAAPSATFLTSEVSVGKIQRTIASTGSLQAVSTVEVSSQLSGQISELSADFNSTVKAGEPLAQLDPRGFFARVKQAEAELAMAEETIAILMARLERSEGVLQESIARRDIQAARVERANIALQTAVRMRWRTGKLAKRGVKSKADVEDAKSAHKTAMSEVRETEAAAAAHEHVIATNLAGLREVEAELANARAGMPLRQASLDLAKLDLERATIRAPIDGIVIQRNVEKGQTVAVSLDAPTLFTIAGSLSEMEIHANVDETDIGEIGVGQNAEFTVDAYPSRKFPAQVTEIRKGAEVNQGVVSYTVVLRVLNPQGLLLPGMTANARIVVRESGTTPMVPLAALRFSPKNIPADDSQQTQWIWMLNDAGQPEAREIELGIDDGRDVAISGNIAGGELVITGYVPQSKETSWFGLRF